MLIYGVVFSWLSILKHQTWHSYFFDLGIFDQVIWNTAHGRLLESSFYGYGVSYLSEHFSPILVAFAPLYLIWSDVRILLGVQSLYIAAGAWPVYLLARKKLDSGAAAVLLSVAFLLFPNTGFINLFDFHPDTLLIVSLPWALYFLDQGRDRLFIMTVVLSLLIKEHVGLIAFALGMYAAVYKGKRVMGLGVAVLGLAWFASAIYLVIPYFRGDGYRFFGLYAHLGSGAPEILFNLITRPVSTLRLISSPEKLLYLFQLLSPEAFLPLLNPALASVALPVLVGNLLAVSSNQFSLLTQYSTSVAPIFFASTIGAITFLSSTVKHLFSQQRHDLDLKKVHCAVALIVLLFSFIAAVRDNPVNYYLSQGALAPRPNQSALEEAKRLIPPDASLAVSNMLGAQFSQRRLLSYFPLLPYPSQPSSVEYILVDLTDWDVGQPGGIKGQLAEAAPASEYQVLLDRDNVILLKKR